jgi:hypothetical protein
MSRKAGQVGRKRLDVPIRVNRILRVWILTIQVLLWSAIAVRGPELGPGPLWATIALGVLQLYLLAPLLTRGKGLRDAAKAPAKSGARSGARPAPGHGRRVLPNEMTIIMDRTS